MIIIYTLFSSIMYNNGEPGSTYRFVLKKNEKWENLCNSDRIHPNYKMNTKSSGST